MATNRADTLDPALLRPGRLDRKIEFPVPDRRQKRMVFTACTAKMNLSEVSLQSPAVQDKGTPVIYVWYGVRNRVICYCDLPCLCCP